MTRPRKSSVQAGVLDVAYLEWGDPDGWPCVMGHGFPYDAHVYAETAPLIAAAGARVVVPWLRGYGDKRFLSPDTPRSGEQAALGGDMLALMDALGIERAVLGGYDWGGRAACVVAALWPERCAALVSAGSYNIQNIARCMEPATPEEEASFWYMYFFHNERGVRALTRNRRGIARLLWRMWSPGWDFSDEAFARSAAAFDNPDFVDVVIHSYRHRYGLAPGDPAVAKIEARLAAQPQIIVPIIALHGASDGVDSGSADHGPRFSGPHEYRVLSGVGHNAPQERPETWAQAVLDARRLAVAAERA